MVGGITYCKGTAISSAFPLKMQCVIYLETCLDLELCSEVYKSSDHEISSECETC